MKKEKYDSPSIEPIEIEPTDVITISIGDNEIGAGDGSTFF